MLDNRQDDNNSLSELLTTAPFSLDFTALCEPK